MVSILPRVGLHENTEINSFCILRLFRLDTLKFVTLFGREGSGLGEFNVPHGIAIDVVFVSEFFDKRIRVLPY